MNESFSVLIPDGESEFALFAAHCLAHDPGVAIHVLSDRRWAAIRFSRYLRSYTFKPTRIDDGSRLEAIADLIRRHRIDVLLPTGTRSIAYVVAQRQALSRLVNIVPLPESEALEIANNKWRLAQFLEQHQMACPPTTLVTGDADFARGLRAMRFPVLLKPVSAWGGEGIQRFEDAPSLEHHLARQDPDRVEGRFIVQTLLSGYVVGVNVLAQHGRILATTMQRGIIPNTDKFAAAGAIRFIKDSRFHEIAQRLISALGWSGFANLDTFYDDRDDRLSILEINARLWGSLRGSLVAGVSFPYLACLAALDIPFPLPDYDLARYVHTKTALREAVRGLVGRNRERAFALRESGLKFLLADPLAEIVRALQQEVSSAEPVTV